MVMILIKAVNQKVIDDCVEEYGEKPTKEEFNLHKDNCVINLETYECPRKLWNGSTDQKWLGSAKKR